MGAEENAAIVRRGYEAFNSGEHEHAHGTLRRERSHGTRRGGASLAGDHQGRDGSFAYFGRLGQETGGTFRAELQHLCADDGDRVVGIHRCSGERDGKHLDVECCLVFQSKDGLITDGREHFEDLYAWDEFWS